MSEAEKVYVVIGSLGEYSDRREWVVVAYRDKATAESHVVAAEAHARAMADTSPDHDPDADDFTPWQCKPETMHPWDTEFDHTYESLGNLSYLRYWATEVSLADALPEAPDA